MTILVTGASGFVGSALCNRLLEGNNTVIAPLRSTSNLKLLPASELLQTIIISDLNGNVDWKNTLINVDAIVHLAARVHVMNDTCSNPLEEFRNINVNATLNLARQAAQAGVKRFVYISSIKVNGEETFPGKPFTAHDTPAPVDPYGRSKFEAEFGLKQLASKSGMDIVIIRPPLVYGPGVKANFLKMMQLLSKGIVLPFGAINNTRSLVALDNLVDFIILCMNHPEATNKTFLVSDNEDLSTTVLLKRLANALDVSCRLLPVPAVLLKIGAYMIGKPDIARRLCGSLQIDISKSRDLLGWRPPCGVNDELKKVAIHFLAQKVK